MKITEEYLKEKGFVNNRFYLHPKYIRLMKVGEQYFPTLVQEAVLQSDKQQSIGLNFISTTEELENLIYTLFKIKL